MEEAELHSHEKNKNKNRQKQVKNEKKQKNIFNLTLLQRREKTNIYTLANKRSSNKKDQTL